MYSNEYFHSFYSFIRILDVEYSNVRYHWTHYYCKSISEMKKPYDLNVSFPLYVCDSAKQKVTVLVLFAASHKSLGVAKQIVQSGDRTDATCSSLAMPQVQQVTGNVVQRQALYLLLRRLGQPLLFTLPGCDAFGSSFRRYLCEMNSMDERTAYSNCLRKCSQYQSRDYA